MPIWLLTHWRGVGIALIVATLSGYVAWQKHEAEHWRKLCDEAKADNLALTKSLADIELKVGVQNTQVNAWQSEAARRTADAQAALGQAAKFRALADQHVRALYQLQLPKDECDALRTLVDRARAGAVSVPVPTR